MSGGPFLSAQSFFAMAKEATRGTAVTPPTIFLPISPNPTLTPNLTWIDDTAIRGYAGKVYDSIPSVQFDEFAFKGYVFADTFPNLMLGILGGPDAVTGTVAPYTHTISLLDAASTGSQPPSYTGYDVDQVTESTSAAKQFAGGQLSEIEIDFAVTGALNYSAKFVGNPFSEVSVPTASWSSEVFIPAWNGVVDFGTVQSTVLEEGKFTIQRDTKSIFTVGSQSPYANFADAITVTGDLTFLVVANDTTMTSGLTRDHQAMSLTFTDPVSSHSVKFQMSQVQFKNPKIERSKPYVQVTTAFEAQMNTTDGVSSAYSPLQFVATNAQNSTY